MKKFTKYHGCGNDFIIVNDKDIKDEDHVKAAISWCHRTTGIGADGLIIVKGSPKKGIPVEMKIYNSDGSLAPMCGNGIRCFAEYCYDEKIVREKKYPVKTDAGVLNVDVKSKSPFLVEIDMGQPDFDPRMSGIDTDLKEFIDQKVKVDEWEVPVGTFFMGTIHTVIWHEDIPAFDKVAFGEKLSNHPIFKEKTNVNMAEVINRDIIKLITYERGAGLTAACGTGACASVVYGIREGKLNNKVQVLLPHGELVITQREDGTVFMQGPAEKIADGQCYL